MSIGLLFWIVFILCIILRWAGHGRPWIDDLALALLIFLLGWGVFGFPIHG